MVSPISGHLGVGHIRITAVQLHHPRLGPDRSLGFQRVEPPPLNSRSGFKWARAAKCVSSTPAVFSSWWRLE
jgi:hypothetical protein